MHAVLPIWFVFFLELLVYGFRHWNMKILWKFKVIWAKFNAKLEIYNGSYNDLLQNVVWVRQILVHRVILSKMNLIPMKELLFVKELVTFFNAWKMSKWGDFSGAYFPVLGLNTEIYSVNLRIHSEYRKTQTRKNSVFGHFSCRLCKYLRVVIAKNLTAEFL